MEAPVAGRTDRPRRAAERAERVGVGLTRTSANQARPYTSAFATSRLQPSSASASAAGSSSTNMNAILQRLIQMLQTRQAAPQRTSIGEMLAQRRRAAPSRAATPASVSETRPAPMAPSNPDWVRGFQVANPDATMPATEWAARLGVADLAKAGYTRLPTGEWVAPPRQSNGGGP